MIYVRVETGAERKPESLADLIASMQGEEIADDKVVQAAAILRAFQAEADLTRSPWQQADTVDFCKLDDENDWTDV